MSDTVAQNEGKAEAGKAPALCWICGVNPANSAEHKTKRSDLLAVLGKPTRKSRFTTMTLSGRTAR